MKSLATKPNLLFLIIIRAPTFPLIAALNQSITRIPFDIKLFKALTIKRNKEIRRSRSLTKETYIYLPHKNAEYLHSINNEPAIEESINLGSEISMHWYFVGKRHRGNDKPAYIYYRETDRTWTHRWFKNDVEHRDSDEPSSVYNAIYDPVTNIRLRYDRLEYAKEGKSHRENGPAIIDWDGSEQWYLNNKMHRIGGPAYTNYNGNRDLYEYEYWENGVKLPHNY
jgi:hypothetical protein